MRMLLVVATAMEAPGLRSGPHGPHEADVLVTGVGMVAAAARTMRALAVGRYDVAFNFGVCGAFDPAIEPGDVVHVTSDCLSELGVEDGDRFVSMEELGLVDTVSIVNAAPPHNVVLAALPRVRGITVNTVHGHDDSITAVVSRVRPQVESMEGAAFMYACEVAGVPYAQVRAVSNRVERRNRAAWRLDLAIGRLNDVAREMIDHV